MHGTGCILCCGGEFPLDFHLCVCQPRPAVAKEQTRQKSPSLCLVRLSLTCPTLKRLPRPGSSTQTSFWSCWGSVSSLLIIQWLFWPESSRSVEVLEHSRDGTGELECVWCLTQHEPRAATAQMQKVWPVKSHIHNKTSKKLRFFKPRAFWSQSSLPCAKWQPGERAGSCAGVSLVSAFLQDPSLALPPTPTALQNGPC